MSKVNVVAVSDMGRVRTNNEDNLFCDGIYQNDTSAEGFDYEASYEVKERSTYAVFDGMGGTAWGEEAALLATETLKEYCESHEDKPFEFQEVFQQMNERICQRIRETKKSMGSTAVLLTMEQDGVQVANLGDSRAYLFRDGELIQLSKDHTKANSMLEMQKELGIEMPMDVSELENVLSQHLGIEKEEFIIEPEISKKIYGKDNDLYILCSDGLTSMVSDEKIAEILAGTGKIREKVKMLKEEALAAGGKDNITMILIQWLD